MTLIQFMKAQGLFLPGDNMIAEFKKLTDGDRDWFRTRAKIEYGIDIAAPSAA